jgi:hypothetical protein
MRADEREAARVAEHRIAKCIQFPARADARTLYLHAPFQDVASWLCTFFGCPTKGE